MEGIKAEINIEGMEELTNLINKATEDLKRLSETLGRIEVARLRVNLKMQEAVEDDGL